MTPAESPVPARTAPAPAVEPSAAPGTPARGSAGGQRIVLVAAVADNGVIGRDGDIPWRIPEDLRHFRKVTTGHTVVMGRVTFESIGRPLPNRTNVVITRDPRWSAEGVTVVGSIEDALEAASSAPGDVMVMGGAQVYEATLPVADVQILTEVHQTPAGDTYYPAFDRAEWRETRREAHDGYDFVWLERR